MALSLYNIKYTPKLFTLHNDGVLCYLNSLIQSLASCSAFNEYLLNKYSLKDNKVAGEYIKLFSKNSIDMDCGDFQNLVNQASSILREIIVYRKNNKDNLKMNRQEDIYEGLTYLLESIGGDVDKLFHIKYRSEIVCLLC